MILPDADWRQWPGMDRLLAVLDAPAGETRFVGGCIRDTLLGIEVSDVDLATRRTPEEVIARLGKARIKAVPTGIAHGTVTAVIHGRPIEVTTLRRDVSTDGRHATVAFTLDTYTADVPELHHHAAETVSDLFLADDPQEPGEPPIDLP